jgi:hypothetical protein
VLDPRVRKALLDYQAGRCGLEDAAQMLLQVRPETGCLELQAQAGTPPEQQRLAARCAELVRTELGA